MLLEEINDLKIIRFMWSRIMFLINYDYNIVLVLNDLKIIRLKWNGIKCLLDLKIYIVEVLNVLKKKKKKSY